MAILKSLAWYFSLLSLLASVSDWASAQSAPPKAIPDGSQRVVADVVLKGGTLVDGTASPRRRADLALRGDRIVAVGSFEVDAKTKVIDASSLIVAPGFIDLHTHSDDGITLPKLRLNQNYLAQGVTTIVTGNCGFGALDVHKYLAAIDAHGAGTNVIHLIPHGAVRSAVVGNADRRPSAAELDRMKRLVDRGMEAGAWGMSSGLIYVPSRYADTSELIELAKVVRRHGGFYASHIRNEGIRLVESIDEAIAIGKGANIPVHISHLKASGKAYWRTVGSALDRIIAARRAGQIVTADQYPYIASSTQLAALIVPDWAIQGTSQDFARLAIDPQRGPVLRREIERKLEERDGGTSIRIARHRPRPDWAGLDLVTIGAREGKTPVEIVIEIQKNGGAQAISFGLSEDDVQEVMRHEFVATASDGSTHLPGQGEQTHPRAYGTFPRKVRYALDDKLITLEQAIRSCSGWPAEILGLPDRGVIRTGAIADLVVFDPETFRDAATFDQPTRYAPGVKYLFVNGVQLITKGTLAAVAGSKSKLPGHALRLEKVVSPN